MSVYYLGRIAFTIGDDIDAEIRAVFNCEVKEPDTPEGDNIKTLFKEHKKLAVKSLNGKWDILSLGSYVNNKIVPRGLRERVDPATHLQKERFLEKWIKQCIDHEIEVMKLIIEEERIQLEVLQSQVDKSRMRLEPFKDKPDFERCNAFLKKK